MALAQLRGVLAAPGIAAAPQPRLTMLQASVGSTIHLVALADVVYFEAADKYVRVVTMERDYLIRLPLSQLLPQLDGLRSGRYVAAWSCAPTRLPQRCATSPAGRADAARSRRSYPSVASIAHLFRGM